MARSEPGHLGPTEPVGPDQVVPRPAGLNVLLTSGTLLLMGYLAWLWFGPREYLPSRDMLLYCLLLVTPVLSFAIRSRAGGATGRVWRLFAVATLLWLVAEVGYTLTTADLDTEPVAWVDWLYILAPVLLYAAVAMLARVMLPDATVDMWLDGLIIAFATAAFATLFYPSLLDHFADSVPDTIIAVTEPLTGLLLVSLIVAVLGLTGAAAGPMWWMLLFGAATFWLADLVWLFELGDATYANGSLVDTGWPAGLLLMGLAAWAPMRRPHPYPQHGWAMPLLITAFAFGVILFATTHQLPSVTVVFAGASVLVGGIRSLRAFRSASIRAQTQRQAFSDDLTGLANRRGLAEALAASPGQRALLLVDIDRFKQINDTLGHQAGDDVLQQLAARFQGCAPEQSVVARLGGDEFAILLPPGSEWSQAGLIAEHLHEIVGPAVVTTGIEIQVEISIGIAFCPQHGTTISELLRTADRAIYRARRDRVGSVVFEPAWDSDDRGALLLMQELRKAVDRDEFVCHYQPQLDVITDQVVAVESLVRWQHPQRGLIPADQFLPMLEQTALIRPLSDLVLDQSLA
ncbi:MAG TPA: bifunctional diguanylate cyclase/phosphodiesterase, partial [Actinomycetota bacterium]|nr:bifunctional diguanylate cyclase/phosphodiesterase [Actinomycetota bacterium]